MSTDPKLDIKSVSLNDLLGGLADRADAAQIPQSPIDIWLADQGIYPGTTRILARDLYLEYRFWRVQHPEIAGKVHALRVWGKYMTPKFKTGRGKRGIHYYISRQATPDIPPEMSPGPTTR